MNLELFHFIRPYWLFAFLPLFIILWLLIHRHLSSGNWAKVCDSELLPYILIAQDKKRTKWPFFVLSIAGLLAIFALAGPTWERLPQPAFRDTGALVILLDLSRSMDATDLKPSRLVRARFKVADILKQRQEGQTALVVYAGDAFVVTPLTDDTDTIASQLSVLETSIMPSQGSRADIALKKAVALLEQAGVPNGNILFVTDGVNVGLYEKAIQNLKDYQISILGVGTPEGSPIPLGNGGFLKDTQGAIVIPKLEANNLNELAKLGGGIYQTITNDDSDIKALATAYKRNILNNQQDKNKLTIDTWREQGPWLLLLLLPLAALGFRRGLLPVVLIFFFLPIPQQARAWDWNSLWFTPDQQASKAFKNGDMQKSADLFNNPEWKGAAQYKAGKYEQALKNLNKLKNPSADDWYNKGNALARLSRYPEAIEAYNKALELNPKHKDALYNKTLIEKQQKSQKQKKQDSKKQDSKKKDSKKKDSKKQDAKKQDSKKQDSKKKDSKKQDAKKQDSKKQDSKKQDSKKQDAKKQDAKKQDAKKQNAKKQNAKKQNAKKVKEKELEQAREQLLRQIPDDPAGLLRRKFKYQYQQQTHQPKGEQTW